MAAGGAVPDLLRDYTEQAFLFISPSTAIVATGGTLTAGFPRTPRALADLKRRDRGGAVGRVIADLFAQAGARGIDQPVLVGAVPFDTSHAPHLSIADRCQRVARAAGAADMTADAAIAGMAGAGEALAGGRAVRVSSQTPRPAPAVYEHAVTDALTRFQTGALGKVVLSRTLELALDAPLHVPALMQALAARNPRGYTYAVPLATRGEIFLGATPELLVRRLGRRVLLNPLAGSAARRPDRQQDQAAAQALMASSKDRAEHAIVIDAIADVLRPLCRTLDVPATPSLVATDALWHLSTAIEGELLDADTTSLDLAFALHPTPAVCGYPTEAAMQAIGELESFDRGFFAGFVGWMDASGDGEWAVSLRCAHYGPGQATLYAGAGVVPGSVPARESAETQTKFRTMLSALGLSESIDPA